MTAAAHRHLDAAQRVDAGLAGQPRVHASRSHLSLARGDVANATLLGLDAHCGTHVDAPRHFVRRGRDDRRGRARTARRPALGRRCLGQRTRSTRPLLERLRFRAGHERLLLRTDNSSGRLGTAPFHEDYVGADARTRAQLGGRPRASAWSASTTSRSSASTDPPDVHEILLGAGTC